MADNVQNQGQGVQTTGHVWDGTLEEYNNPLPVWWTYAFYATIVFALVYWVIYPSWPIGKGYLLGTNTVTYVNAEGQEESWHWNTRAKLLKETQDAAAVQKPYLDKVAAMPFGAISKDPEVNSFVISAGKALFSENCRACHQEGGAGKVGSYPNLADDDWLYGGSYEKISETIVQGRRGYMPPFGEALTPAQIEELASYVLSLSGNQVDNKKAAAGKALFQGHEAACFYCHGDKAKGRQDIGSANLTDKVWLWADVPGAADDAAKLAAVKRVIVNGLDKGVMPAWGSRLSEQQIKLLTVYVHDSLGGGK